MKASLTQVPSVSRFHRLEVPHLPVWLVPPAEQAMVTVAPSATVPASA
jgi:hypothetical protein